MTISRREPSRSADCSTVTPGQSTFYFSHSGEIRGDVATGGCARCLLARVQADILSRDGRYTYRWIIGTLMSENGRRRCALFTCPREKNKRGDLSAGIYSRRVCPRAEECLWQLGVPAVDERERARREKFNFCNLPVVSRLISDNSPATKTTSTMRKYSRWKSRKTAKYSCSLISHLGTSEGASEAASGNLAREERIESVCRINRVQYWCDFRDRPAARRITKRSEGQLRRDKCQA